jgi:hypothetical protein
MIMTIQKQKDEHYKQLALDYKNRAKLKKCKAAIHLESDFDVIFWDKIFKYFSPQHTFDYVTYSKTAEGKKATGCTVCLKYHQLGCLSKDFFICIDSDYRYLLQEKNIDINHFIFQTYTYSLENHYCYPQNINNVFKKLGLANNLFDFETFLETYSRTLYELFIYHLVSLAKDDNKFPAVAFNAFLNSHIPNRTENEIILELQNRINDKLIDLKKIYPDVNIENEKKKYQEAGLNNNNAYLYFRGHHVLEQVVLKIIKTVRKQLETTLLEKYPSREKKAYYSEKRKSIGEYLMEDLYFHQYPEINKIERDIKTFPLN